MQQYPLITLVGGDGFLGRHLVKQLAKAGYRLRILARDAVGAEFLKTAGHVGQIATRYADITKPETLHGAFEGSWAVINLVGILHESGRQTFDAVHARGARAVAEAAQAAGATRLIHISALGVERASDSHYAQSKRRGEDAVRAAFPAATIMRPSLLIGPEDRFFQRFARMSMVAPALPLIGGGHTKFQPTLVQDVAQALLHALALPETAGQTYELGGPEVLSFKAMLEQMMAVTNRRVRLVTLPSNVAQFAGWMFGLWPFTPPLTADQVRLLRYDNVLSGHAPGYQALNIEPGSVTAALPHLLSRYVKH